MSKFVLRALCVCAVALMSAGALSAQAKIAVVNIQKAIIETAEIKKAQTELEAKYKPRQVELEKAQKELADIESKLQDRKLNEQTAAELQARGQMRQKQAQRQAQDLQDEVDRERNDILQSAGQRMSEVIKKYAEEKGFDVVIDAQNTHFFKPALEVTNDIVVAYDKAYPAK